MEAKIISGFPGVGKSYLFNNTKLKVLDSDSSEFSWVKDGNGNNTKERSPEFPSNYMKHIKDNISKVDIILVSSHDVVRNALKDNSLDYTLVYPNIKAKEKYVERYKQRGSDEGFINFISSNWENFIRDIELEEFPIKIELESKENLSDLIIYGYCDGNDKTVKTYIADALWSWRGCPIYCSNCDYCIKIGGIENIF